jgi:hypothetical protein
MRIIFIVVQFQAPDAQEYATCLEKVCLQTKLHGETNFEDKPACRFAGKIQWPANCCTVWPE